MIDLFDSLPSAVGAAAIAPSLLLLWIVSGMDQRPEPERVVLVTFLLGVGSIFLLWYVRIPFIGIAHLTSNPIAAAYLHATIEVAAPEEAVKLIVLVWYASRFIAYDHPMEGVVYGAAAGLGFAAHENLAYLAYGPEQWGTLALVRGLLTVPVHGALGVIAGLYVARAHFGRVLGGHRSKGFRAGCYLAGWAIVTGLHGLYDFPLVLRHNMAAAGETDSVAYLTIIGLLIAGSLAMLSARIIYRIARAQAVSPNSFTTGDRFRNHPWHLTGLASIAAFLVALPLLGLAREFWMT